MNCKRLEISSVETGKVAFRSSPIIGATRENDVGLPVRTLRDWLLLYDTRLDRVGTRYSSDCLFFLFIINHDKSQLRMVILSKTLRHICVAIENIQIHQSKTA
jgi:hypothetical protein